MSNLIESSQDSSTNEGYKLPSAQCLQNAARLSVVEDKPIMLDYWLDSLKTENQVLIGVKSDEEKLLVKRKKELRS